MNSNEMKGTETIEQRNNVEGTKAFNLNDFNQIIELIKNNDEEIIKNNLIIHVKSILAQQADNYKFVFLYGVICLNAPFLGLSSQLCK